MVDPFISQIVTRSGLNILKENALATIEVAPWASKTFVYDSLYDDSQVVIPLYGIRYDWITSGN